MPPSDLKVRPAVVGGEQIGAANVKSKAMTDAEEEGEAKAEERKTWAYPMSLGERIHSTETMVCVFKSQGYYRKVLFNCLRCVPFPPRVLLCCLEARVYS